MSRIAPVLPSGGPVSRSLFVDLYELTMAQAYFERDMQDQAVFSLFVRRLPDNRNFLLACGMDATLASLEELSFDAQALEFLDNQGLFTARFLDYLAGLRFEGDVFAVPDGTPMFADEPLLEVVAPLPQAQLVETVVLNQMHLHTALASKAARVVAAARGNRVVDFGARRMHGFDAALAGARALFIAGVDATSNVAAGQRDGIPMAGTMAHSYVQAFDDEAEALRSFTAVYPETVLLVDTYDTIAGVRKVVELAAELGKDFRVTGVRLDSGNFLELSHAARRILDSAGLTGVEIFASGGLDEYEIERLLAAGAPIDGFGVGSAMGNVTDAPALDMAYKLVEYAGKGRMKLSAGKRTLPGQKQVYRFEEGGIATHDVITLFDAEPLAGEPLLLRVMQRGERLPAGRIPLATSRARARESLSRFVGRLSDLKSYSYSVEIGEALRKKHEEVAAQLRARR